MNTKIYLTTVLAVVSIFALFGGILPALVSAKSTEAVLLAFAIIVLLPVGVVQIAKIFNKKEETK